MVTDESIERWKRVEQSNEWFPEYFVSQPPHRDMLQPTYYKVVSPSGPVFWRRKGDETGQETSFYDLLMEEMGGFGIQYIEKEHTPWAE